MRSTKKHKESATLRRKALLPEAQSGLSAQSVTNSLQSRFGNELRKGAFSTYFRGQHLREYP